LLRRSRLDNPSNTGMLQADLHRCMLEFFVADILTFILLMWRIGWAPNNASKWQVGFNSAFKGLRSRSPWQGGLRRRLAAAWLLGSQVRIPLKSWRFVFEAGSSLCDELITWSEESYRVCVCVCVYVRALYIPQQSGGLGPRSAVAPQTNKPNNDLLNLKSSLIKHGFTRPSCTYVYLAYFLLCPCYCSMEQEAVFTCTDLDALQTI
jgi:hypothetical protein